MKPCIPMWNFKSTCSAFNFHNIWLFSSWMSCGFSIFPKISHLCLYGLLNCSHQTLSVRELFSPLQVYFSILNLTAILNILEAILQVSFCAFLTRWSLGLGFPWGFSYCMTYQSPMENDSRSDFQLLKTAWKSSLSCKIEREKRREYR